MANNERDEREFGAEEKRRYLLSEDLEPLVVESE